jgi:hypothetical protein
MERKTIVAGGAIRCAGGKILLVLLGIVLVPVILTGCSNANGADVGMEPTETVVSTVMTQTASGVEVKIVKTTAPIPYESEYNEDESIDLGDYKVTQEGEDGTKEVTYRVTYTNGIETARELVSEVVTKEPVTHIESVGMHVTHHEDPMATTSTSTTTTSTTDSSGTAGSACPSGAVAICADGTVSMGSTNPSIPVCAGRGGVARTCP